MQTIEVLLSKITPFVEDELCGHLTDFANGMRFSKSQNTILSYLYDLKIGLTIIHANEGKPVNSKRLKGLNILQFRSILATYRQKKISVTSQQRFIISWKLFLRFLDIKVLDNFRMPKKPERHPRPISEHDILQITELPINPTWIDYRNRALWSLMYGSGLRISEALSLKKQDLAECVKIVGKGKKSRVVPILPNVMTYIQEYLEHKPSDTDSLFLGAKGEALTQQSASHVFRIWRDKHNLPSNITLHSLRHSFATHLLRNNCPLPAVQKLLGHSDVSRTMQYLSISSNQLRQSYKKYMEN
jgi:integrase/recombinase XerC